MSTTDDGAGLPRPTPSQLAWQNLELGLFLHFQMFTFYAPAWTDGATPPSPDLFNPTKLDCDQWMEAAVAMGAKYAILTAKHYEGFCLWPTDVYDFSVKQSSWRGGKGDVVGDFIEACHRHHIKPGLYYSTSGNLHYHVVEGGLVKSGDKAEQARYAEVCEKQLRELWTRYGELTEVWFDGGVRSPEDGGPRVGQLLAELQPNAVVFGYGCPNQIRWVGNEDGVAPDPCWATGDPDGKTWAPAECDVPIRKVQWRWQPGEENLVQTTDHLVDLYYRSVGHNCNLLLNANPNTDGLVPEPDMTRYHEFGHEIARRFGKPVAETKGDGDVIDLVLPKPATVDHMVMMEDIARGERVREYSLRAQVNGLWQIVGEGTCIGHKKIDRIKPVTASHLRLKLTKSTATPHIRSFALYHAG